jgi:allantoin racemase
VTAARKIMIVNPNTTESMTSTVVAVARAVAAHTTELIGSTAVRGVESVDSNVDEVWGTLGVLEQVRAGEAAGVDGYVIACVGDTGLDAARETARGPVVGMTEAALFTAALLAARFAMITLPPCSCEQSHRALRNTGLWHRCAVRAIDVAVADVAMGSMHVLDTLIAQARAAMDADAAEAIVLGCAGLSDLVAPLTAALNVPVVDGIAAAVTMVEGLLAQGLATSRASTYSASEPVGPVIA